MPHDDERSRASSRQELRWIAASTVVVVFVVIPPFLIGALASQIAADMAFSTSDLGWLTTVTFAVTCALSPVAGTLVARLGSQRALRIASALSTVSLATIALAGDRTQLLIAVVLIGAATTLVQPSTNEVLSRVRSPLVRSASFGLVQASIPTASLLAGSLLGLASYGVDWRTGVLCLAVLTLGAQALLPAANPHSGEETATGRNTQRPSPRRLRPSLLLAALAVSGCLASGSATVAPVFSALTGEAAGTAAWLIALAQACGSIGSALVRTSATVATAHRPLAQRLGVIAALQAAGVAGMLALSTGTTPGFVVGAVLVFALGWGWNGLYNLVVTMSHPEHIPQVTGITQASCFLGGAIGSPVFAVIAQHASFTAAWLTMAALMAVATSAAVLAARLAGTSTDQSSRYHRHHQGARP